MLIYYQLNETANNQMEQMMKTTQEKLDSIREQAQNASNEADKRKLWAKWSKACKRMIGK